jgi:ElaB/YqjD/DUF883 family membrane-anchored ribosome-binding protein
MACEKGDRPRQSVALWGVSGTMEIASKSVRGQSAKVKRSSDMSQTPADDFKALREDFDRLRKDVGELADSLKQAGREQAEAARQRSRESLNGARDRLRDSAQTASERSREYYEQLEHRVGDHPLSSLVTAFGVGFILAKLLDRGDRR